MVAITASALLGRAAEGALVETHLAQARDARARALMFVGEPGSGKTSLLEAARSASSEFTIVACRGVEWEAELPFSGLHELLGPLLGNLHALPDPQREALEGALGLAPARVSDALNVYAGALSLLVEATRTSPVLVVVDDLQWIDSTTTRALSFIARRLVGEPLGMLIASRPGTVLPGLSDPPVELAPLTQAAVAELAGRSLGRRLPQSAARDLTAASGGNPLAVIESVRHFGDALWLRGSILDEPLPVGELIDRGFSDRLAALSTEAGHALEAVAASVTDDSSTVFAAVALLGLPQAALVEAEREGIVTLEGARVEFAHPLLRSLVHRRTDRDRLRACHAALAEAGGHDAVLRAWHAASALTIADETIAADLDTAAAGFVTRGGHLAASQALARSADLTPDPDARARRLIRAGRAAHLAGLGTWASTLFDDACTVAVDPRIRMRGQYESAVLNAHLVAEHDVAARHMAVADEARGIDDDVVADALCSAILEGIVSGQLASSVEAMARLRTLLDEAQVSPRLREESDAAIGVFLVLTGADDGPNGDGARRLLATTADRIERDTGEHAYLGEALIWIEAFDLSERFCAHIIDRSRAQCDVFNLAGGLWVDGYRRFRIGDWTGACRALEESVRLSEASELATNIAISTAMLALIGGARGDGALLPALPPLEDAAIGFGMDVIVEYTETARGLTALSAGRGADAAEHFERVRAWTEAAGHLEPCVLSWPADLVDAYLLAGDRDAAVEALETLRARSLVSRRPWAVASVARLDGLLAAESDYEAHFTRALAAFDATPAPFDRARAQLGFGQRLRRSRRKVEAREQLTAALAEFERLGAEPWAQQARREMGASTATLRKGPGFDPDALTPQEQQVADLVAGGATNKEVAGAMFLSPKTIETHLSRIYRKLGVSSRTQLAARMRSEQPSA